MRRVYCLVAAMAGTAVLFVGSAAAARPGSAAALTDDLRLSGPGIDISVVIPPGWHQIASGRPGVLQMVYPDTCTSGVECASATAILGSGPGLSAQTVVEGIEQVAAGRPGVRDVTVTSAGPFQILGHPGYQVRFRYANLYTTFQAEAVAVETRPPSSGVVPTSVVLITVADLPVAPAAGVIDQIVSSVQLTP